MILQNNNVRLNIEGNRISNLVKNSINEISVIKNMDKNSKIKELTKLYRVQKGFHFSFIFFLFLYTFLNFNKF